MSGLITVSNEKIKTIIDVEKGTDLRALYIKKNENWLEVMPDTTKETQHLDACSFLMVPYSNRIENGTFNFEGNTYHLKNAENHSIHGDVRKRPWDIKNSRQGKLVCSFDTENFEDINWPWPFYAEAIYRVEDNKFISKIKIRNSGEANMPVGCGWHPYFNRVLEAGDKVNLKMKVDGVYPDTEGNCIPCAPAVDLKPEQDFRKEKEVDPDQHLDNCFCGYDGKGYIHWNKSGVKLNFECSENCGHLIIFNPQETFFAVEPVTNANNGVNMLGKDGYNSGVKILSPNEELNVEFVMSFNI